MEGLRKYSPWEPVHYSRSKEIDEALFKNIQNVVVQM